jgi:ribosomal protein S18 acetylase RimI-like enzyme
VTEGCRFEPLAAHHDRRAFSCGVAELDRYFYQQVTQDIRRRVTNCFVAIAPDDVIAGYYTLASASIPTNELPTDLARRLPRYPTLPAVRIGRLAVDLRFRGQGFGRLLLLDAANRALHADQANFTLLVDAKDDRAVEFYRHYGFIPFTTAPRVLFLPLTTAAKCLNGANRDNIARRVRTGPCLAGQMIKEMIVSCAVWIRRALGENGSGRSYSTGDAATGNRRPIGENPPAGVLYKRGALSRRSYHSRHIGRNTGWLWRACLMEIHRAITPMLWRKPGCFVSVAIWPPCSG